MVKVLVDVSWCCHRYHYSYNTKAQVVASKRGEGPVAVGVLYGFAQCVKGIRHVWPNADIVFCVDNVPTGPRAELLEEYKAGREHNPEVYAQKDLALSLVNQLPYVSCAEIEGQEADDVMAFLFYKYHAQGHKVIVHTSDNDMLQLMSDGGLVYHRISRTKSEYYDEAYIRNSKKYHPLVTPKTILPFRVLRGDTSDNISSVYPRIPKEFCALFAAEWVEKGSFQEAVRVLSKTHPTQVKRMMENQDCIKRNIKLMTLKHHKHDQMEPADVMMSIEHVDLRPWGFYIEGNYIKHHVRFIR